MTCLLVPAPIWNAVRAAVASSTDETAGVLFAEESSSSAGERLVVRDVRIANDQDYVRRGADEAVLTPQFVAKSAKQARDARLAVVYFHSHPFSDAPVFSPIDDQGERALSEFLNRRAPGLTHCALVIGRSRVQGRVLAGKELIEVRLVGPMVETLTATREHSSEQDSETHDRQIRAFGIAAQSRLSQLNVGIVGLGGTGSLVAEWLAHLGIRHFELIDPDVVEASNLNRVVGSQPTDVGTDKVAIAARHVRAIRPDADVRAYKENVTMQRTAARLCNLDALFSCTDSHGSRSILNQLAYQFFVPCFDLGVAIVAAGTRVTHVVGRAQMLAPGLPCLACQATLDPEQVRRDMLSDYERKIDPYILGGHAPQPAVISLNATVASLAVTMFLGAFAHVPVLPRHQMYDGMKGVTRAIGGSPVEDCVICSPEGAMGRGASWTVPGRLL